jgi:hypothetical protein
MNECIIFNLFNDGVIDLAHNHLQSLKNNNITNYISFTTGINSYNKLKDEFNVEYININDKNSTYLDFGSNQFCEFSYARYKIMLNLLKKYKYVWYLDVDTVVLGNIFNYINFSQQWDICCQDDLIMPCTGCMLVNNTQASIDTINKILSNRTKEINDQVLLKKLLVTKEVSVKIISLSKYLFIPGGLFFDMKYITDKSQVLENYRLNYINTIIKNNTSPGVFVHANYIMGNKNKIDALKSRKLWFIKNV